MEVSKLEKNQSLRSSYLTAHSEKLPYPLVSKWPELILHFLLWTMIIERLLARKGVLSCGALGLNTLCRGCSSHTRLVGLLYPGGNKSEKVCTGYKV